MTNVFVTNLNPRVAARNLDNKRLSRMAFEAYEAICAGLANIRYPGEPTPEDTDLPYFPRKFQRSHNVSKWVGADRWHAWWTLLHADECSLEHQRRYGTAELGLSYRKCHEYLHRHISEFPTKHGPLREFNVEQIEYYGAFNFDWFRWENTFREGYPILHPDVHLVTRYRLSMLHKWLYLDARAVTFGPEGPPAWAFKPAYRDWIDKVFGPPWRTTPSLTRTVDAPRVVISLPKRVEWDPTTLAQHLWSAKISHTGTVNGMLSHAIFNTDFPAYAHRYVLTRQWDATKPPLVILMTNPSTADHTANDKTIDRVVAFAKKLGYGGVIAMNVFSFRAREPEDVIKTDYPVTADSYVIIMSVLTQMRELYGDRLMVVAAWGALAPSIAKKRGDPGYVHKIVELVERAGCRLHALELSQDGHPKHPLYLKGNLKPVPYEHRP